MRARTLPCAALILVCANIGAHPAFAQKQPVQLSLVTPVQIFPPEDTIAGVRLNIIYGRNAAVNGLDIGLVNHTTEIGRGVQWGVVGIVEDFQGWHNNFVNIANGKVEGWQDGWVNVSDTFRGFQSAIVNYAGDMEGFQLAIVNYASTLKGLQIGLVNIIARGGMLPVFPIFNIGS